MVEQLLNHIRRHSLCKTTDKILLAVSGGIDSCVMLHLFLQAGFSVGVAHCNFQLRDAESDADEKFVAELCGKKVPLFSRRFNTKEAAAQGGISIQMAARKLRYQFFDEVMMANGYDFVATAHQLDDSLETVLLNLTRGTGLDGLTGIPVKNNKIIRPMLFASREKIRDYANEHGISWREDSSNATDDYARNLVRHRVVETLRTINPGIIETFATTQERLESVRKIAAGFVDDLRRKGARIEKGRLLIERNVIAASGADALVLWEILREKNFNYDQCRDIVGQHQPGKVFYSVSHSLTIDRDLYIVQENHDPDHEAFVEIKDGETRVLFGSDSLSIACKPAHGFRIDPSSGVAQLDFDKIEYPLIWRRWRAGDSFVPLGMSGEKKISDFLIDSKLPMPDKENVSVIESLDKIIWVVGMRIDDRFKVNGNTRSVLVLEHRRD